MNPEFKDVKHQELTEEQKIRMAVELRLAGMPANVVEYYSRSTVLLGAYRLWFGDTGWKETMMQLVDEGRFPPR